MTIGGLSRRAGLSDSTIRYYERAGLIEPDGRTSGNYRYYGPKAVERLRFIRAAQGSGLSLEDVRTLLEFRDGLVAPCKEVQHVIEARLAEVNKQMQHLRHIQRVLKSYQEACEKTVRGKECPVLDQLRQERD